MNKMSYDEMNFERCKAQDERNALRKQNGILEKALKGIKSSAKFCIKDNQLMSDSSEDDAFNYANGILEKFIKTINKALKEKIIK